jgi:hypothetical protein
MRLIDPQGLQEENPGDATPHLAPNEDQRPSITLDQAKALFESMAAQKDIPFNWPKDGCYARAHVMAKRIQEAGEVEPGKVWSFGALTVDTPHGNVTWAWHVAPSVPVATEDGGVEAMVIDPSLFDAPVTVETWKAVQGDPDAKIIRTRLGEPPIPSRGGTGYWPAPDPPMGTEVHAARTNKRYTHQAAARDGQ